MTSSPLGSTHSRTTSGVACNYSPWTANTVERRRAWHAIIAFGQHTRSNDVGHDIASPLLYNTHSRTTLGMACHHRLWAAHTVERRRVLHAIFTFWLYRRSNDVRRDMPSPPLDSTHDRTTLGMACHHHLWAAQMVIRRRPWNAITALGQHTQSKDVGHGMTSPPLDSTHGRTTWEWNDITALGLHARSDDDRRGLTSLLFDNTHGKTTSGVG